MTTPQHNHAARDWLACEMQLTAFPAEPQHQVDRDWFQQIAGDEFTSTRTALRRTYEARIETQVYRLVIEPSRIVWSTAPVIDPNTLDDFPALGNFIEACEAFTDKMRLFLANRCPPIVRLGFVPQLMLVTDSQEESYRQLALCLPRMELPSQASEFQYRINRKRTSAVIDGLTINRLATWSAAQLTLSAESQIPGTEPTLGFRRTFHGCLLRLDVNTEAERKEPLQHDRLGAIWDELSRLGKEISEDGDIP